MQEKLEQLKAKISQMEKIENVNVKLQQDYINLEREN